MAKKKSKKKAAKSKTRRMAPTELDLAPLVRGLSSAQKELNRLLKDLAKLRPICLRVRVVSKD